MNWIAEKPKSWNGDVAVIVAHGAGQGMASPFMTFFHTSIAGKGCLSIKFNFDYMELGKKMPDRQPILQARYKQVIEEMSREFCPQRMIIGGKSMGGRVASYIADDAPRPSGLIFLGYPLHPPGKTDQLRDSHLYTINLPMLFISGTNDNFAERSLLERVTAKIGSRATLRWIEEGDHSLQIRRSGSTAWPLAVDMIAEWLGRI